jgi:hypothetical protein
MIAGVYSMLGLLSWPFPVINARLRDPKFLSDLLLSQLQVNRPCRIQHEDWMGLMAELRLSRHSPSSRQVALDIRARALRQVARFPSS